MRRRALVGMMVLILGMVQLPSHCAWKEPQERVLLWSHWSWQGQRQGLELRQTAKGSWELRKWTGKSPQESLKIEIRR